MEHLASMSPSVGCALSSRPRDVPRCSAAPEEFSRAAFLACFLFRSAQRVCTPHVVRVRGGRGLLGALCRAGGGGGHTQKDSEAGYGRPVDRGVWTTKTVKRPPQQPAQPPIRQLLGPADTQTAHPATFSTAPTHQLLGSANAETTPAGAPAAAADRTQRPDATCEEKNG